MQLYSYASVDENGIDMVSHIWEADGTCPGEGGHDCRCVLIKETTYSSRATLNSNYVPYQVVEDVIGTSITDDDLDRLIRYEGPDEAQTLSRHRYRVFAACINATRTRVKAEKKKGGDKKKKKKSR